jgi:hypothetical protein
MGYATVQEPDAFQKQFTKNLLYKYKYYPKTKWCVHSITADISDPSVHVELAKGLENIAGLERVQDISRRYDSLHPSTSVIAAINANFWRAGSNHPIGPTAHKGQIIISEKHNNWTSVAISPKSRLYFDHYSLTVSCRTRYGEFPVSHCNYRKESDSSSIILYNQYFGSFIPARDTTSIMVASADSIKDDSEDSARITAEMNFYALDPENGTLKIQYEYLRNPLINTSSTCIVTRIDTGFIEIPKNGGVLSFGRRTLPFFFTLGIGDTISLETKLDPPVPEPVAEITAGTPRIIRNGKVSVEWQEEGLRKKRFVTGKYPRTAVGISKDQKRLILFSVEGSRRGSKKRGIDLENLAKLMVAEGVYQAINLDGGSSATLVLDGEICNPSTLANRTRKISTALLVIIPTRR